MKRKSVRDFEDDICNTSFAVRRHKRLREEFPCPAVGVPKLVDYSFSADEDDNEQTDGQHDITIPYIPGLLALDLKMSFDFERRSHIKGLGVSCHGAMFARCSKHQHTEEKRRTETFYKSSEVLNNLNITYSKSNKTRYFPKVKIGSSIFRWFSKRRSKSSKCRK